MDSTVTSTVQGLEHYRFDFAGVLQTRKGARYHYKAVVGEFTFLLTIPGYFWGGSKDRELLASVIVFSVGRTTVFRDVPIRYSEALVNGRSERVCTVLDGPAFEVWIDELISTHPKSSVTRAEKRRERRIKPF
jgi:hypothetical protein